MRERRCDPRLGLFEFVKVFEVPVDRRFELLRGQRFARQFRRFLQALAEQLLRLVNIELLLDQLPLAPQCAGDIHDPHHFA